MNLITYNFKFFIKENKLGIIFNTESPFNYNFNGAFAFRYEYVL